MTRTCAATVVLAAACLGAASAFQPAARTLQGSPRVPPDWTRARKGGDRINVSPKRFSSRRQAILCAAPCFPVAGFLASNPLALQTLGLACFLPPCLGLWKAEYTVSYGYGFAMALSGGVALAFGGPLAPLAVLQAAMLFLYGTRLNLFLLWRERNFQYFRDMVSRIEKKNPPNRLKRLPAIAGCGLLYLCMASPLVLTSRFASQLVPGSLPALFAWLGGAAMVLGFSIAAIGDAQKSAYKAKNEAGLVTQGLFRLLRHPNYTGETVLWSGSLFLGAACAAAAVGTNTVSTLAWMFMSGLGCLGINFVLVAATTNLERRQREKYGTTPEYARWVESSWRGFTFPSSSDPKAKEAKTTPALEGQ